MPSISRGTLFLLALWGVAQPAARADEPLLERDILPILTKQCLGCHGGLRQKGNLDLRTIPAMLKGGDTGPAIQSGQAKASELWKRIESDEMPPHEKKLSTAEKTAIKNWIAAGLPTVGQRQKDAGPGLPSGRKHPPEVVANAIDQHLNTSLIAAKLKPAPKADDVEFLRRVYLDLTGRVPTAEQAVAFLDSSVPGKRSQLIDALLASPQFGEQFGRTWRDWICPPELPSDANGGRQPHNEAQNLGKWLGTRFAAGDSWDTITREILTVEGDIKTKPQLIYFGLAGEGGKVQPGGAGRSVGSLFLGVQLQCAECHDDPYKTWSQREYWSLAAFFSKTNGDFNKIAEAPASTKPEIVIPKSAFKNAGTNIPAGFLGDPSFQPAKSTALRSTLVDWMTKKDNPFFAKAFANRLWFYFFARGIVNPVDDLRELNPPSHPGLLKLLANEFADSGFDIKHLIRCICNSEAYQRTSRVVPGTEDAATSVLTQAFGRMPLRVMSADVLLDSLKLAYGDPKLDLRAIDPKDGNTNGESAPVADAYLEFLRRFGTNEDDATDFTHGIPQMLAMINHPRLLAGSKALDAFLKAKPSPSSEQILQWLYLSTLSRRPTTTEQADALRYMKKAEDPTRGAIGVLWMLVNRTEYMLVR
jgi:mono/diheme cytochrome c family protein